MLTLWLPPLLVPLLLLLLLQSPCPAVTSPLPAQLIQIGLQR
jgi:hypothetical protein